MNTFSRLWRNGAFKFGFVVLMAIASMAVFAPWLGTVDPTVMDFNHINEPVGLQDTFMDADGNETPHLFLLGTDSVGRDLFSRIAYGARISLLVGLLTAAVSLALGVLIGMLSGYFKGLDMLLMRFMDGLMAIPAILLAIALVAALGGSVGTVVVAIAIPEIPRVSRLVRSLVLTLREEPFVEAARALATPTPVILWRHILPNALAPLVVQGTFVAASAILVEAILSFLGLGLPPDIPTWGNIMAEGRELFNQFPGLVLLPAAFLIPTVLAFNMLGDGLRDVLDPKFAKRGGAA